MFDAAYYMTASDELVREARWEEQRSLMDEALKHFPDNPEFCLRYALSVSHVSPADAADYAHRASEIATTDPALQVRCASLFVTLDQAAAAKRCIDRAAPLVDDDFPLVADMFHIIGVLGRIKGNSDAAERYLRLAFEIEPSTSGHALDYATYLVDQGQTERALDVIAQGLEHASADHEELLEARREIERRD